jgi:hypothetical protein
MGLVDVVELGGAVLILAAFAGTQKGVLGVRSRAYLVLNVVGAGALAAVAAMHRSWGFLLLEGTWTAVSAVSLAGVLIGRASVAAQPPSG